MTEPEEDFAALFEASLQAKRLERGQTVEGRIVAIGPEVAFVDVGGKGEALIDIEELKDESGSVDAKVGDRIQAVVVSTEGGLTLSRKLARAAATVQQLEDAFHAGLPVEGKVDAAVKGGYEVRLARQRAFCPTSQIDTVRNTEPSEHVGRVYPFKIVEFKDGGRNLVVSRRAVLEQEQRTRAEEVRRTVVPGAVLTGRVTSVVEFGAFVDLGAGVQGLLHVSEMAWSRVPDIKEIVKPGDEITVKVLRVDEDTQKIALGLKQLSADPWSTVHTRYAVGQVVTGRVTRLAQFGAFIEIEPGVEALAHASTFPPTGQANGWRGSVPVGSTASFEILSVEPDTNRVGVALVPEGAGRSSAASAGTGDIVPGARLTGTVERHEPFGVFVFLGAGRTGLIPMSETAIEREADVKSMLPVGSDVEVMVLEVDHEGRRIRLSRKAVLEAREADELRDYHQRTDSAASGEGFGASLADKLRNALEPRER